MSISISSLLKQKREINVKLNTIHMQNDFPKIRQEKDTLLLMIKIYCRGVHNNVPKKCVDCSGLLNYSFIRLDHCPWGENKPACSKCPIHCYSAIYRKKILEVMRYAGPRMILKHPLHAIRHLLHKIQNNPNKG